MPIARGFVWPNRSKVTAAQLNAEFDIIHSKLNGNIDGVDLKTPFTMPGSLDMNNYGILNASQIYGARIVYPGTRIQDVVDEVASSITSGLVILAPGTHTSETTTITLPVGISLVGPGAEACSIESSFAGPVIAVGDGTFDTRFQDVGGFQVKGQSGNTTLIRVNNASGQSRTLTRLFGLDLDGIIPAGTLAQAIEIVGAAHGVYLIDSDIRYCTNVGLKATSGAFGLRVMGNRFGNNGVDAELIQTTCPQIIDNDFDSSNTANLTLDRTIAPGIQYNRFNGSPTDEVHFKSNGATDATNNRGGLSKGNVHKGGATYNIRADGVRGHAWEDNTFVAGAGTRVFRAVTGTQSKSNAWRHNWSEYTVFNGDPYGIIQNVEDVLTSGHSLSANALRIPHYDSTAGGLSVVGWGAAEYGRMWVEDNGTGTQTLHYFARDGAEKTVALT